MGREFILNGNYKLWEGSTHDAIQLVDTVKSLKYNLRLKGTAKKLCNTRTFISTSYKWFILGIALELLHIYLYSYYRFLELVNIALNNFK